MPIPLPGNICSDLGHYPVARSRSRSLSLSLSLEPPAGGGGEKDKGTLFSVDTTSKLALYQDCNTLVTRIEIRIMRLRKDKGVRIKGALQATQDPNSERT